MDNHGFHLIFMLFYSFLIMGHYWMYISTFSKLALLARGKEKKIGEPKRTIQEGGGVKYREGGHACQTVAPFF